MLRNRKVSIIGDGAVGSTIAYTLFTHHTVNEIVIIDLNKKKAEGDVLDMIHGMSFVSPKILKAGEYSDCKGSNIIVITAGVAQKEGETRQDLLLKNVRVMDSIIESIKPYIDEHTIILMVTNPVDVLTYYVAYKLGIDKRRVIGSGTVLDTARLKSVIADDTHIDPRNIHTFVIGEHGDSEVPTFSITTIGGLPIEDYCARCGKCNNKNLVKMHQLHETVKNAAYEIISKKGATFYAVALSVDKIIETILNDQNSVLTVSTYVENEFDGRIKDVYMSLPCVVNSKGVEKILRPKYNEYEINKVVNSGKELREKIELIIK